MILITPAHAQPDPPGQLYTVNGTELHLYCTGQGQPTVLLEAGVGGFSLNFALVQPLLAEHVRVCSYDRRGYGWSAPLTDDFDLTTATDDLHALLQAAAIEPPYVIVAHSFGAIIARSYQATHPDNVLGLLMLDPVHPQMPARIDGYPQALRFQLAQLDLFAGVLRNSTDPDSPLAAFLPDDASRTYLTKITEPKFLQAARAEATYLLDDMPQAILPTTLDDLLLIVVRHGLSEGRSFLGAPMGRQATQQAERTWITLQTELAALSSDGVLHVAERSQHNIQFDQPDLVAQLTLKLIAHLTA